MNRSRVTADLASHGNIFVDIANDRVGIGSTIPTHKIDVSGTVKLHDHTGYQNHITYKSSGPAAHLHFPTGPLANLARTPYIGFGDRGDASGDFKIYHDHYNAHLKLNANFGGGYGAGLGGLFISNHSTSGVIGIQGANGSGAAQNSIYIPAGATAGVKIYQAGQLRFETVGYGVTVHGTTETQELNVTGVSTFSGDVTLTDTTADSAAGPEFKLFRNSASPADADYLGQIKFAGESDTGVERNYAKITGKILDASNGTEDGILEFAHIKAGSQTITGRWRSDSLQLLNSTNLSVAGDSTFTGDIDVDGHTELDNARIVGIVTASTVQVSGNQILGHGNSLGNQIKFTRSGLGDELVIGTDGYGNSTQYEATIQSSIVTARPLVFATANAERLRILGGGQLIIGHNASVPTDTSTNNFRLQVSGTNFATSGVSQQRFQNGVSGATLALGHSRNATQGNHTILQVNDEYGKIRFYGSDGTDFEGYGAGIVAKVETGIAANSTPGRLEFHTTASGAQDGTERIRISPNGDVRVGGGAPATFGSGTTVHETYNANNYVANLVTSGTHQLQMIASQTHGVTSIGTRSNHKLNLSVNDTTRATIDTSGHMGLGVTPSAWPTNGDYKGLQVGSGACIFGRGSGDEDRGGIAVNYYGTTSGAKYITNGHGCRIYMADGNISLQNAASNSSGAGAAMTLNTRVNVDATDGHVDFTGSTSSTLGYTFTNATSGGSADTRVLIKSYANGGGDPYIKFDAGGQDMVVGTSYAGTTNNLLCLGPGSTPSINNHGIRINGLGKTLISYLAPGQDSIIDLQNKRTRASGHLYGIDFRDSSNESNANIVIRQNSSGNNAAHMDFYISGGTGGNGITNGNHTLRLKQAGDVAIPTGNLEFRDLSSSPAQAAPASINMGGTHSNAAGNGTNLNAKFKLWSEGTEMMGMSVSSNQFDFIVTQEDYDYVWYAGNSGTTEMMRLRGDGNLTLINGNSLNIDASTGAGQYGALLNIGWDQGTNVETRAIDIGGGWSSGENKRITFSHSTGANNLVGEINSIHYGGTPSRTSPHSGLRFGKLYHNGDSTTFTMTLDSTSATTADLNLKGAYRSSNHPVFIGHAQSGQSNIGSSTTKINYSTSATIGVSRDFYDTTNNRFVAPVDGVYTFYARHWFQQGNTGEATLFFYRNGSQIRECRESRNSNAAPPGYVSMQLSTTIYLSATNYVEVQANGGSGSNFHVSSGSFHTEVSGYLVC